MPRIGAGLFNAPYQNWQNQNGLQIKFYSAYTGFASIANLQSGAYYATHQYDVAGTYTWSGNGIIPVISTSLVTQDGGMTLASVAAGTNDAAIQLAISNAYEGGNYTEIWWRPGYELNIQTCPSGWPNNGTAWGPALKAAWEHWATVARAYVATNFPGRIIRLLFDTCPLNNIASGPDGNALSLYKPDPVGINATGGYDIFSIDFYTGNYFPQSYAPLTNYASLTPFTLNATYGSVPAGANVNNWASDYTSGEAPGGTGYTYNNAAHFLTFQDAQPGSPNGGSGQSLYSLIQQAETDQVPLFHTEFGGIGSQTVNGQTTTGSGWVNLCTTEVVAREPDVFYAMNDLNYIPYMKRLWAQVDGGAFTVPFLGFVGWDMSNATLMSGPDPLSGNAHYGMRSSFQVLRYPLGNYGAVDPILVVNDLTGAGLPGSLPVGTPVTVRVDANYALTLANLQVNLGTGAGFTALPSGASLIGSNSATFQFTPAATGPYSITVQDTVVGYESPSSVYDVGSYGMTAVWASGGQWSGGGSVTVTSPNNNTEGSINYQLGSSSTVFPVNAKTYCEFTVSGAAIQTAFCVGFSLLSGPGQLSNYNITAEGTIVSGITHGFASYNQTIGIAGPPGVYVVYDPQGNATYSTTHPGAVAAPNQWYNGSVIGMAIDRVSNPQTVTFFLNGAQQGGPFNIESIGSAAITIFCSSWYKSGPVVTINGGSVSTKYTPPSGYTPLDKSGVTPPTGGPTAITVVVTPSNPTAGTAYTIAGTAVTNPFSGSATVDFSNNQTTATDTFHGEGTGVISGNTITFSGITSGLVEPHYAVVRDEYYGIQGQASFNIVASGGTTSTTTYQVNDSSVILSPCFWYNATGYNRTITTNATTVFIGSSIIIQLDNYAATGGSFTLNGSSSAQIAIDYAINGTIVGTGVQISGSYAIPNSSFSLGAANTIQIWFSSQYTDTTTWTVTGYTIDTNGTVKGTANNPEAGAYYLWYGDSIGKGNSVPWDQNYEFLVTNPTGYGCANSSVAGSGWLAYGNTTWGAVYPTTAPRRWNLIQDISGTTLPIWDSNQQISAYGATGQTPYCVITNLGTNEALDNASTSAVQTAVQGFWTAMRTACGTGCVLVCMIPFGLYATSEYPNGPGIITAIKAGVAAANTAGANVQILDLGSNVSSYMLSQGTYIQSDNIHPTAAGYAYLASLVTPALATIISNANITQPSGGNTGGSTGPGPSTGVQGLPYYGWGTMLCYANSGPVAGVWNWFASYFCVGRTMLFYAGNFSYTATIAANIAQDGAVDWSNDPTLNGTNTGKHCIPVAGSTQWANDGLVTSTNLSWPNAEAGNINAYLISLVSVWWQKGFLVQIMRWGYEDNYPTTPSGMSAYSLASGGGNQPYYVNGSSGALTTTPWMQYSGQGYQAMYAQYISGYRAVSYIMKTAAKAAGATLYMAWGPTVINSNAGYSSNASPTLYYPDNTTSDGKGSLVDMHAPDWYSTGFYGPTTAYIYNNYNTQQPYTKYTGTPTSWSGGAGYGSNSWDTNLGTLYYAMDFISGTVLTALTSTTNYTAGWSSQESLLFALAKNKPWGVCEFGTYTGPGTIYAAASTNYDNVVNGGTTPWLGAYFRSRMNWFTNPTANGYGSGIILQVSYWKNQPSTDLTAMANAYPEFKNNPDAGLSSGGTSTPFIYASPIAAVGTGTSFTVSVLANYVPTLSNFQYSNVLNGASANYVALPGGATVSSSSEIQFPVTASSTPGNYVLTVKDTSNGLVTSAQPYTVALSAPANSSIQLPATIPDQGSGVAYTVQVGFNAYKPTQGDNIQISHGTSGGSFVPLSTAVTNWNATWNSTGQILSLTFKDGIASEHSTQVQDTSFAPVLQSVSVNNNIIANSTTGGGTITVPTPTPASTAISIAITAPGSGVEGSPGAGITPTMTITASNISTVYSRVMTSGNTPETSFISNAIVNGNATLTQLMLANGDYIQLVDNTTTPTITVNSSPVTITDSSATPTIVVSAPGTVSQVAGQTGVTVQETVTTTNLTGNIYSQVFTSGNSPEGTQLVTAIGSGGITTIPTLFLQNGDYLKVQNAATSPTVTGVSSGITIVASTAPKSITVSSPGTQQEAYLASSITYLATITTTGYPSGATLYAQVNTASGAVEDPASPVTIDSTGATTYSAVMRTTGDYIVVSDSTTITSTTVQGFSGAVTIQQVGGNTVSTQTISITAPGLIQEASGGAGVTPNTVVTTTNMPGGLIYRIRTSAGATEVANQTILPVGAAITVPSSIPTVGAGKAQSFQVAFNYAPDQTKIVATRNTTAQGVSYVTLTSANGWTGVSWSGNGQLLTLTSSYGTQAPHQFAVRDTTTGTPLQSSVVTFNVGSSGTNALVTVTTPTAAANPQQFKFNQLMLVSGDYIQATSSAPVPTVTGQAGYAYITYSGSGPYTYTINFGNNGSTTVGTFWFGWQPGQNYLTSSPTVVPTTGWTGTVVSSSGYSIQWVATTAIAPGATVTFSFTSADAPSVIFGYNSTYTGTLNCTSITYAGAPSVGTGGLVIPTDNNVPGTTAKSSPVTITDSGGSTPAITISAPGTLTAATVGGSVQPALTVTVANLSGNVYGEVLTASGAVESGFVTYAVPSAWTSVVSDNFSRANTVAGGAGSTTGAGNNWIDVNGGVAVITSDALVLTTATHNQTDFVMRPFSEAALNSRMTFNFVYETTGMAEITIILRAASSTTIPANYYLGRCNTFAGQGNPLTIFATSTTITNGTSNTLTNGTTYTLDFQAVGSNPTTLTLTLSNTSTGAQIASITGQDSTSTLQDAGSQGFLVWTGTGDTDAATFTQATTYTGAGGTFIAAPTMLASGDVFYVVNSTTSPTTTATSSPVTILNPNPTAPTLTLNVLSVTPSTTQLSGFVCQLQIITSNFSSSTAYYEVLTSTNAIETAYTAVSIPTTPGNSSNPAGNLTINIPFANSGDSIQVVDQIVGPNVLQNTGPLIYTAPVQATVSVTQPSPLNAGVQTISGQFSTTGIQPTQIYLYWTAGTNATLPNVTDAQAVLCNIVSTTSPQTFYGAVNITGVGVLGSLYYDISGAGTWQLAWSGTPIGGAIVVTIGTIPAPFNPGKQVLSGTITNAGTTMLVCLRTVGATQPVAGNPDVVTATVSPNPGTGAAGLWTATVIAGNAGIAENFWVSTGGGPFSILTTITPTPTISVNQPVNQVATTPYTAMVDFGYILSIPQGGPVPSSLQYSETGGAPFSPVTSAPGGVQVTVGPTGNSRLIIHLNDPVATTINLIVQDTAPPGGGSTIQSNIAQYIVTSKPTATGSPFIFAYNPLAQQTNVPFTAIADFNYLVSSLATIKLSYSVGGAFVPASSLPLGAVLQPNPNITNASRIVFTLSDATAGNDINFQVEDTSPLGSGSAIYSQIQQFAVLPYAVPTPPATETYNIKWTDGSISNIVKNQGVGIVSQGFTGGGPTTATSIVLWVPPQTVAGKAVTLTGTFTGGPPQSLDYSLNGSAGPWVTALPGNTGINASTFTYSIVLPNGVPAAARYLAGLLGVRDTNNHAAAGYTAGAWVVNPFSLTVPSAGTFVAAFDPSNPQFTTIGSNGAVNAMLDLGGSARILTAGPTTPPGTLGGTFTGANPVNLLRLTGADNGQTGLGMTCTTDSIIFDNNANFFDAGPLGGPNDPLINLVATSNVQQNNFVVTFGAYLNVNQKYQGGPIWGSLPVPAANFITAGRWNGGNGTGPFTCEIDIAPNAIIYPAQLTLSASAYMVITCQQVGTTFQFRINKGAWNSTSVTGTFGFTPTNFGLGGSFILNIPQQSGNAYQRLFASVYYDGTPSPQDIGNAETYVGNTMGLNI